MFCRECRVAAGGAAIAEAEYDSSGNVVEARRYDANGGLME